MSKYQLVLFLSLASMLIISAHPPQQFNVEPRNNPRRVNCMKYVFAPICRGAASKRIVTDISELVGDDPDAHVDDGSIGSNEHRINSAPESQYLPWFFEKRYAKRFHSVDPEYATITYPGRFMTNSE